MTLPAGSYRVEAKLATGGGGWHYYNLFISTPEGTTWLKPGDYWGSNTQSAEGTTFITLQNEASVSITCDADLSDVVWLAHFTALRVGEIHRVTQ
jgi:hypothetical protein